MLQFFQLYEKIKTRRTWQIIGYLLSAMALLYAVGILVTGGQQIRQAIALSKVMPVVPMVLAMHFVSYLFQFFIWMRLLSFRYMVGWHDVEVYSRLVLLRFLPGGILQWLVRIGIYHVSTGIPGRTVVVANFVEWSILLLVGIGIHVMSDFGRSVWIQVSLGILPIVLALSIALQWQPESRPLRLRLVESGTWIVLYATAWFLGGGIVMLLVHAFGIYTLGIDEAVRAWTITGGIGMIVGILPISLGIREIALAWLLRPDVPEAIGLLVAFLLRFLFTLADTMWGMLGWLLGRCVLSVCRLDTFPTDISHHRKIRVVCRKRHPNGPLQVKRSSLPAKEEIASTPSVSRNDG